MKIFVSIILSILLTLLVSQKPLHAVTNTVSLTPSDQMKLNMMDTVTPTPSLVDYQLPYPGILPDNPLYKLKALRDKIVGFLISDPLKKADFDILQADKRYNAALYLFRQDAKKETFISDTISKADNYFYDTLNQLDLAKNQGEDIHDAMMRASLSNQKHIEVLHEMEQRASKSLLKQLAIEEKRTSDFTTIIKKKQKQKR